MSGRCPHQHEAVCRRDILHPDAARRLHHALHLLQEGIGGILGNECRVAMHPGLQPDPVGAGKIRRRIGIVDQTAHHHVGAMLVEP
ncbi:hypothetical protein D3C71_2025810 [compost metagenome]